MNDVTVNELRARERNLEEEWISKYRAALQAVPNRETWEQRLREAAFRIYRTAESSAREMIARILTSKVVTQWLQIASPNPANVQPDFSVVRTLPAIKPHSHRLAVGERRTKKAG